MLWLWCVFSNGSESCTRTEACSLIWSVASSQFTTALRVWNRPRWCCRTPASVSSLADTSSEPFRMQVKWCERILCRSKWSITLRNTPHHYWNSNAIQDHTVLPATWQSWHSGLYPSWSWYSIKWPRRDARLSWPSWLVTYQDDMPTRRRSPIPVLTGLDVG